MCEHHRALSPQHRQLDARGLEDLLEPEAHARDASLDLHLRWILGLSDL